MLRTKKLGMCFVIIVGALLFFGATQMYFAEEDLGICEKAFIACIAVNLHPSGDVLKCYAGYAFCKDYVEPLIK